MGLWAQLILSVPRALFDWATLETCKAPSLLYPCPPLCSQGLPSFRRPCSQLHSAWAGAHICWPCCCWSLPGSKRWWPLSLGVKWPREQLGLAGRIETAGRRAWRVGAESGTGPVRTCCTSSLRGGSRLPIVSSGWQLDTNRVCHLSRGQPTPGKWEFGVFCLVIWYYTSKPKIITICNCLLDPWFKLS